jgi:hypothetical protein
MRQVSDDDDYMGELDKFFKLPNDNEFSQN